MPLASVGLLSAPRAEKPTVVWSPVNELIVKVACMWNGDAVAAAPPRFVTCSVADVGVSATVVALRYLPVPVSSVHCGSLTSLKSDTLDEKSFVYGMTTAADAG